IEVAVLAGSLHFDEFSLIAHDYVHVDLGANVLFVVEIQAWLAIDHADTHGGNASLDRRRRQLAVGHHPVERVDDGDARPCDGGRARSAIRDKDIAIELDGELTKLEIVEHGTDTAPDQPLDLLRAAAELGALTRGTRARRTRKHGVLGGKPALTTAALPARNAVLDRSRAQHTRGAKGNEARAL